MSNQKQMSWPEAFALLHSQPGVEICSLRWEHAGKYVFRAPAQVRLPDGREEMSPPVLWFSDHEGVVYPWEPMGAGENRSDWIVGRSPGKRKTAAA